MWRLPSIALLALAVGAQAQLTKPSATPRPLLLPSSRTSLGATPAPANAAPPRDIPLVEKKFEQLSSQELSDDGKKALAIDPKKWRHAETENFVIHYRRVTEAQKVVREVEYDLWYVAGALGATRDRYLKKSHVYVFEDEAEWQKFLYASEAPIKWAASYAWGDELFLNIRGGATGTGGSFDSATLAHETTHAVVARLYPQKRWPVWLNEGFAEYMGGASQAARKGQTTRRYEQKLRYGDLPLDTLFNYKRYPADEVEISRLYQSSERFVRFLMSEFPKDRIAKYVEMVIEGTPPDKAVIDIYGDKVKDWETFQKRYEKFAR